MPSSHRRLFTALLGTLLGLGIILGILACVAVRSANKKVSDSSVLQKIFLSAMQVLGICSNLDIQWPDSARRYLGTIELLGRAGSSALAFDCLMEKPADVFFVNVSVAASIPFLVYPSCILVIKAFCVAKRYFARCCRRHLHPQTARDVPLESARSKAIAPTFVILTMIHPDISYNLLLLFRCKELGEEGSFLVMHSETLCWGPEHLRWVYIVGIPWVIGFVLGWPIFVTGYMKRNNIEQILLKQQQQAKRARGENGRGALSSHEARVLSRVAFLVKGYQPKFWYWESISTLRKLFVLTLGVFLSGKGLDQTVSILITINIFITIHAWSLPFERSHLNHVELVSSLATSAIYTLAIFTFRKAGPMATAEDIAALEERNESVSYSLLVIMVLFFSYTAFNFLHKVKPHLAVRKMYRTFSAKGPDLLAIGELQPARSTDAKKCKLSAAVINVQPSSRKTKQAKKPKPPPPKRTSNPKPPPPPQY